MRWIVFFLFVLNALVFIWFSFQQEQKMAEPVVENEEIFDFSSVKKVALLSEFSDAELKSRDIRYQTQSVQSQAQVDANCALVGPFLEIISARQTKGRLESMGLVSKAVQVLKQLPVINWVYVPPLPSKKAAMEMLRDMQDKDIDSFLIADGEFENGISLGFFSNLESAKAIVAERQAQGYPVVLAEKQREQKTFWLAFDEKLAPKISDEMLSGLEEGNFAIKKQEKACEEVAQMQIME